MPIETTAPGVSTTSVPDGPSASCLALVRIWDERGRQDLGEVAFFEEGRPLFVGRGDDGPIDDYACFFRQLPGQPVPAPSYRGLLVGTTLSRRQVQATARGVGLEFTAPGTCLTLLNGRPCTAGTMHPGDVLTFKAEQSFLCVRRPLLIPALKATFPLHRWGEANDAGFLGQSPGAWKFLDDVALAARTRFHVLIFGETGAGKAIAARLAHLRSARANGPFVVKSAMTFTETVLESALFGNVKGYLHASEPARPGLFGEARGGTLFLDEVGECPRSLQRALLSATDLGTGVYTPLGASKPIPVEMRLVAATNCDERSLQKDFFERFQVIVRLPALRDRAEDIPLLVQHFLRRAEADAAAIGDTKDPATKRRLSASFIEYLVRHPLTGNVRELEKIVTAALLESPKGHVRIPPSLAGGIPSSPSVPPPVSAPRSSKAEPARPRASEKPPAPSDQQVVEALDAKRGNVTEAAKLLGMSRDALNRLMAKYGLRPR